MRSKLLMGAVAASASLAFAGIAYGVSSPDDLSTLTATAKPADAGTPGRAADVSPQARIGRNVVIYLM